MSDWSIDRFSYEYHEGASSPLSGLGYKYRWHAVAWLQEFGRLPHFSHIAISVFAEEMSMEKRHPDSRLDWAHEFRCGRGLQRFDEFPREVETVVKQNGLFCIACRQVVAFDYEVDVGFNNLMPHWREHSMCVKCMTASKTHSKTNNAKYVAEHALAKKAARVWMEEQDERLRLAREKKQKERRMRRAAERAAYQAIKELGLLDAITRELEQC